MTDSVRDELLRALMARRSPDDAPSLDGLAMACADTLATADVAVQLRTSDHATSAVGASTPLARGAEEVQLTLTEGPSIDAFRLGRPVAASDLRNDGQWLRASAALVELGVHAAQAFPMHVGTIRLGSLTQYGLDPQSSSGDPNERERGSRVTAAATHIILGRYGPDGASSDAEVPDDRWLASVDVGNRAVMHQATGMIAVQLACSLEDALVRLQAHAFATSTAVDTIARNVVDRTIRFRP